MYQALYRKWRPKTFDEVIGQKHITETLKNQIKTGRLSHAYIFIGTRGTGKTTCARILAKAANCEHPVNGNPCGECAACRGIADGTVLDVVELDAASNNGVDNVRALRDEAIFSPASVKKRVYIIDEVHMLSTPAFNALLKILEEPPEHLMFILATTELQKVPATILSRCQRHSFKRIATQDIAEYLGYIAKQEGMNLADDAAMLIAQLADGGVRDALSLLDQCSAEKNIDIDSVYSAMGLAGNRRISQMLDGIIGKDTTGVLKLFSAMWMDGKDPASLLGELDRLLRDIMMLHVAPKGANELISGSYDIKTLKQFSERMTTEELLCAMNTLQTASERMRDAVNPKTTAELCLISLCDDAAGESVEALRARISRLEKLMQDGVPAQYAPPEKSIGRESNARTEYEESDPYPEEPPREEPPFEEDEGFDPAVFAEEQPEDALLDRREAPIEKTPATAPAEIQQDALTETPSMSDKELWKAVVDSIYNELPMGLRTFIRSEKDITGKMSDGVFKLEANPLLVYGRFNKPEILSKFAEAAGKALGHEVRVIISEMKPQQREVLSLDTLKGFKEVTFN